jgi:hypothetical protein
MKLRARLIIVIIIVAGIAFFLSNFRNLVTHNNNEKQNKNLNFVGNDKGNYASSKACLMPDGTVMIASAFLNRHGSISLINLTSDMRVNWEKKISNHKNHVCDFYIHLKPTLNIEDIQVLNDKCFIYAIQEKDNKYNPVIFTTDVHGKLLNSRSIPLNVSSHTQPKGMIINNDAYFTWYNDADKMIDVNKISLNNNEPIEKKFMYLIQDSLKYTSIASNPTNNALFFTTYDPHKGSSLISFTDKDGLKILNDTDKYQTLNLVSYHDSKLYVVATNDTSLAVGLIHSDKAPDRIVLFNQASDKYTPKVLSVIDDEFLIGFNVRNTPDIQASDVVIMKYRVNNTKSGEFIIHGQKPGTLNQILSLPGGYFLAVGNSDSHKYGSGSRVFATRFKM